MTERAAFEKWYNAEPLGSTGGPRRVAERAWLAATAAERSKGKAIEAALRELVRLKDLDDKMWKTAEQREDYYRNKPKAWQAARAAIRQTTPVPAPLASPPDMVLVPKSPSIGRLISMAIRDDHGLGVEGYYDNLFFRHEGATHAQRMEAAITRMRQLYEEATGQGFYNESREDEYRAMIDASENKPRCPECGGFDWMWLKERGEGEGGYQVYQCQQCKHEEVW